MLLNDACPKGSTSASVFNLTRTRRPAARKNYDHVLSANRCTDGPDTLGVSVPTLYRWVPATVAAGAPTQ
ncbi:hypothetical protein JOF47_003454 [Paeniglutamicibacter kerguelensis]|uniref:Transposase n=1 Tax=Paeniglutamicibacter kerguelensis TaxID=254788 RepID=A0ABS4XHJ4_9MICC|nr:hypothetical protein [Paeniglutamicibacter kerguelensis]